MNHENDSLDIAGQVKAARQLKPRTHAYKLEQLPGHLRLNLVKELAVGTASPTLADQYGCTPQAILAFKQRHITEIEAQRKDIENEFAALWIASKAARVAAYENEFDRLDGHPQADHHLWSLARQAALKAVAEELGQLPPRQSVTVIPVMHIVEGVSVQDELT